MKVAVLMSVYNGEKYIREQIESVLNQKFDGEIHLIVRDDGSSDDSVKILDEYSRNKRLRYCTGNNIGAAKSFFELIYNCGEYDYYAFCDQDDVWMSDKIARSVELLETQLQKSIPIIYCSNASIVDERLSIVGKGSIYRREPHIDLVSSACFCYCLGCTCVLNHLIVKTIREHSFPERIIMHDTYIEVLCQAIGGKVIYDQYESVMYRQHSNNVSGYGVGGILGLLRHRFKFILNHREIGISEQAMDIVSTYNELMTDKNMNSLKCIAGYKKNFYSRCKLAMNRAVHYKNFNTSLMYRISILMGNL